MFKTKHWSNESFVDTKTKGEKSISHTWTPCVVHDDGRFRRVPFRWHARDDRRPSILNVCKGSHAARCGRTPGILLRRRQPDKLSKRQQRKQRAPCCVNSDANDSERDWQWQLTSRCRRRRVQCKHKTSAHCRTFYERTGVNDDKHVRVPKVEDPDLITATASLCVSVFNVGVICCYHW